MRKEKLEGGKDEELGTIRASNTLVKSRQERKLAEVAFHERIFTMTGQIVEERPTKVIGKPRPAQSIKFQSLVLGSHGARKKKGREDEQPRGTARLGSALRDGNPGKKALRGILLHRRGGEQGELEDSPSQEEESGTRGFE